MPKKFSWYTGAGDDGTTGLLGEGRVPKHHSQPEALGAVDEATSAIGTARCLLHDRDVGETLLRIQRDLYELMAELAATAETQARFRTIGPDQVGWLADRTDEFGARVSMPGEFVCPGDSQQGATLDHARAVVRRAERRVSRLIDEGLLDGSHALAYLNRLSSLLFVLARHADARWGGGGVTLARGDDEGESGDA